MKLESRFEQIQDLLIGNPMIEINKLCNLTGLKRNSLNRVLRKLIQLNICCKMVVRKHKHTYIGLR